MTQQRSLEPKQDVWKQPAPAPLTDRKAILDAKMRAIDDAYARAGGKITNEHGMVINTIQIAVWDYLQYFHTVRLQTKYGRDYREKLLGRTDSGGIGRDTTRIMDLLVESFGVVVSRLNEYTGTRENESSPKCGEPEKLSEFVRRLYQNEERTEERERVRDKRHVSLEVPDCENEGHVEDGRGGYSEHPLLEKTHYEHKRQFFADYPAIAHCLLYDADASNHEWYLQKHCPCYKSTDEHGKPVVNHVRCSLHRTTDNASEIERRIAANPNLSVLKGPKTRKAISRAIARYKAEWMQIAVEYVRQIAKRELSEKEMQAMVRRVTGMIDRKGHTRGETWTEERDPLKWEHHKIYRGGQID
jgi:hypothetical protein